MEGIHIRETYHDDSGVEVEFLVRTKKPDSPEEMREIGRFVDRSYYKFHEALKSKLIANFANKEEYVTCPNCGLPLCRKSEAGSFSDNYCGNCGCRLAGGR